MKKIHQNDLNYMKIGSFVCSKYRVSNSKCSKNTINSYGQMIIFKIHEYDNGYMITSRDLTDIYLFNDFALMNRTLDGIMEEGEI